MSTLIVYPRNEEQEKALMLIINAFDMTYDRQTDETAYLMSTETNMGSFKRKYSTTEGWKRNKNLIRRYLEIALRYLQLEQPYLPLFLRFLRQSTNAFNSIKTK